MFEDRPATFRGYQTIKEIARRARESGGVAGRKRFNVVDYLDKHLMPTLGTQFKMDLFPATEGTPKAYVKFNYKTGAMKLNVSRIIWNQGKFDFPDARYVLAHEIGHILMHRHDTLAFSANSRPMLKFLPEEERAEPQANLFADLFLVYDDLYQDYVTIKSIEEDFRVPHKCASRRFAIAEDQRRRKHTGELLGDPCPRCANMSLVRSNFLTKCKLCNFEVYSLL